MKQVPNIELMGKLIDYMLPLEQVLFAMLLEQQKELLQAYRMGVTGQQNE
jgi:hypothetical protein